MAVHRRQTWLTFVNREDTIARALVLAESLRRSKTTRRIGVIVSKNLLKDEMLVLRHAFDDLFLLEEYLVPPILCNNNSPKTDIVFKDDHEDKEEIQGKMFAFCLDMFEKCVFLKTNFMVLENSDYLFEYDNSPKEELDISADLLVFTPNKSVCQLLMDNFGRAGINGLVGSRNLKRLSFSSVLRFSMENGTVLLSKSDFASQQASLIQFVGSPVNDVEFMTKLQLFGRSPETGLLEKMIIRKWVDIFEKEVAEVLVHPENAINLRTSHVKEQTYEREPIAIVGMSCRLPGANNLDEFWNILLNGKEGICQPPAFRWKKEHCIFGSLGKERNTQAGFLSTAVDEFDSKFFGVSPKEAVFLDPQTRLLHEVVWEALENGGLDPLSLRGSHTGIFTGSWMNDYKDIVQTSTERDFFRTYMGNSIGASAARLSSMLGVTGPSIATESGCSSAIVAVDLAVKSVQRGECRVALVGGVNLLLHPFESNVIDYVIAPDGRCKTFDAKADGFGRAEGCGVLVLKRLSDALRDRDNIWAIIRGSAISQEGMSRSLGTPTVHCEALAMQLAMKDAGVLPEQVSFVETHGTGTSVGDPMEVAAIAKAYYSEKRATPLVIGSVKTNVGHTESCSGITGIIKTVLAMHNQLIPQHLNLDTVNPEVNLEAIPAVIPLQPMTWPKIKGKRRLAGVSSFGITGTDGHVIIEEAPENQVPTFDLGLERPLHIIKFSAKSTETLDKLLTLFGNYFKFSDTPKFADVAYTANTGRASFDHRAFLLATDQQEAVHAIQENKISYGDTKVVNNGKICFLFTGQGSQYPGMARNLYESSPVFRVHFDYCNKILRESYNLSIKSAMWNEDGSNELIRTIYSQTSIFCVEYCLLKLWESWGLKPDYVLGHSLGEFCAVVAAGIVSFEDALKLVVERSKLIDGLPQGSMLVVKASQSEVEKLLIQSNATLDIAAVNSLEQTVVAGDIQDVKDFREICKSQGLKAVVLEATHAFHSFHMDPILEEYRKVVQKIKNLKAANNPSCNYVSGLEGRLLDNPTTLINSDYWIRHTREKVSFMKACEVLKQLDCHNFIEIGPHPILSSFVMQNMENTAVACYLSLRRNSNDWETMLTSLGHLYLKGYNVDWNGFDKPYLRKKIPSLPFYPFDRKSYWVDCSSTNVTPIHPLIGSSILNASPIHMFQNNFSIHMAPYLKDHCIGTRIVMPGAAFTEMCLSAGYCVANSLHDNLDKPSRPLALQNVCIEAPLELKEGKGCHLQVIIHLPENEGEGFRVKVYHQNNSDNESPGKWVLHANAVFLPVWSKKGLDTNWNAKRVIEMIQGDESPLSNGFYKRIEGVGLKFGESFRAIQRHWRVEHENGQDEVVAEMRIPPDTESYLLHPVVIDAMLQTGILAQSKKQSETLRVPVHIAELVWLGNVEPGENGILYLHAWWNKDVWSVFVLNENLRKPIAYMTDVQLIETNVKTIESILEQQNSLLPESWEEIWRHIPGPLDNRARLADLEPILECEDYRNKYEGASKVVNEDWGLYRKASKLVYLYTLKTLRDFGWSPVEGEQVIVENFCERFKIVPMYRQLIHFYFSMIQNESALMEYDGENSWKIKCKFQRISEIVMEIKELEDDLRLEEKMTASCKIYKKVASCLLKILQGEDSALEILFPTELDKQNISADVYYQNHPGRLDLSAKFRVLAYTLMEKYREASGGNKVLRVLEVGAGTGSLTTMALEAIKDAWGSKFEYYYTDISASFFAKAEKKFEEFEENMKFAVFDVENHPLGQGIPVNYFDAVLAQDVLHATKYLEKTVRNLREVLVCQGSLVFTEITKADPGITFVFGLLDGYWRFQDFNLRQHHPCVGGEEWRKILLRSGFKFVNVGEAYLGTMGIICAESDELTSVSKQENDDMNEWILFASEDSIIAGKNTIASLHRSGCSVTLVSNFPNDQESVVRLIGSGDVRGIIYAYGLDCHTKDQKSIAMPFLCIAKVLVEMKKPTKLFILTKGVHVLNHDDTNLPGDPSASTLFGMAKSLKNENADLFVRYIDLDENDHIGITSTEILYELACSKEVRDKERVQVAYRGGRRYEPRFNRANGPHVLRRGELALPSSTHRYHLVLPKSKMIHDLEFDLLEEELVGPGEVEVKVSAYSLNFRDIFTILKPDAQFENLNSVGLDLAGVVTKVGQGLAVEKLKVGDRVFGVNSKENCALNSHLVVKAEHVLKIPTDMTFTEAATLPAVFATSLRCLLSVAKLKAGETVLIHTGSGGVGLSAIQIAKHIGAKIITTAGNARKRAYLKGLNIEHVFHSRDTSFQEDIMKVTNGRGVDVVLNSITGPGLKEASLHVCGRNGRFVEMSKLNVWTVEEVKALRPDVEYTVVDLTKLPESDWTDLLAIVHDYLAKGLAKPLPHVKFDAMLIRQALEYLQKAKHIGKVVVTMPEVGTRGGKWKASVRLFNEYSTYLITGGLGGIGLEVCKWMLEKGATDIVLIGRSAPKPEVAREIEQINREKGTKVMVKLGDVGDHNQCKAIIEEIMESGCKPIRGIQHCAGILKDNLYSNQTWEAFEEAFNPKVEGTWNLHNLTRDMALEHFVLYSSITALAGTPGQANHAAANCFEDAFAHYRYSMGLPATSINWGQWSQVGCAKEISLTGVLPVSVKRMLCGLETALRSQTVQIAFGDFESLSLWTAVCPQFKYYMDERLLKSLKDGSGQANIVLLKTDQFWEELDGELSKQEKMEVVCKYMKTLVQAALRMEADEPISEDAHMQDLGVDSLMLIELKNSIQSLLGSRLTITATMLKDCNTIRDLASVIVTKMSDDEGDDPKSNGVLSPEELESLLNSDCILDEDIQPVSSVRCKMAKMKTILITGVTGQLGPYILSIMSTQAPYQQVQRIVCLIRTIVGKCPKEKLKNVLSSMNLLEKVDMNKVECVRGDVTHPKFGLDEKMYDELSGSVDGVIHLAVKSNHVEIYRKCGRGLRDIRSVNVGGTLNVLRFSVAKRIKFVYYAGAIISVFGGNQLDTLCDDWPEIGQIKMITDNKMLGYPTSKFVCEMLMRQANERGIPCKVFRFPWILGDSETGQLNYIRNHYILRFLSYLKLKAMPDAPVPALVLPVDICADLSLKLFWNDQVPNEVFNITHPSPQLEVEFIQVAREQFGMEVKLVDWKSKEFVEKLYGSDMPLESLKEIYSDVDRAIEISKSDAFQAIQGYLRRPDKFFSNPKVENFVPGYSINFLSSMDNIKRDLLYVKSKGFFDKFGIQS